MTTLCGSTGWYRSSRRSSFSAASVSLLRRTTRSSAQFRSGTLVDLAAKIYDVGANASAEVERLELTLTVPVDDQPDSPAVPTAMLGLFVYDQLTSTRAGALKTSFRYQSFSH